MDEICCLGLSTQGSLPITNTTNRWIDVRLQVVAVTVNGEKQNPERVYPFITKEKAIIDPGNTEEVKVSVVVTVSFSQLSSDHYSYPNVKFLIIVVSG